MLLSGDYLSEGTDVVGQQVRHFQRREMATLFRFVPVHKVLKVSLAPGAGCRQVAVGWHENSLRHAVPGHRCHELAVTECLLVEPHRRSDRLREPVDREDRAERIEGKDTLNVTTGVTPAMELLHDPGRKAGGRIVESDCKCHRLGTLLRGIGELGKHEGVHPLKIFLFFGRRVLRARILPVDVDIMGAQQAVRVVAHQANPDTGPQVGAGEQETIVTKLGHESGKETRDPLRYLIIFWHATTHA